MTTRLQQIEERLAAATPGKWRWEYTYPYHLLFAGGDDPLSVDRAVVLDAGHAKDDTNDCGVIASPENRAFIEHAPDDLRLLLAVVKAAREATSCYHIDEDEEDEDIDGLKAIRDALAPLLADVEEPG